jgi:RNA 3'-terminal phosphate cyclase (ATP)
MREIDGAYGEGGGQLLRTACALSAITGAAIRLHNVRARRTPAGLAPQHLTAVKAVAALCDAEVDGLELRSQKIVFRPAKIRGGDFRFDVGTAGCLTLVLQALLPAALTADASTRIQLTGGTDIRGAPPLDYFRFVHLPLLARMGAHIDIEVVRRGYYPRGGGQLKVDIQPARLQPLWLDTAESVAQIGGRIHVANLPAHIAARMHDTAVRLLAGIAPIRIEQQRLDSASAGGSGGAIALWASGAQRLLGGAEVAQRGVPAERIAATAAGRLRDAIHAGATVDVHAGDQLLIYTALAGGPSCFRVDAVTAHAHTALWLLGQFFPLRVGITPIGAFTRVEIERGRE